MAGAEVSFGVTTDREGRFRAATVLPGVKCAIFLEGPSGSVRKLVEHVTLAPGVAHRSTCSRTLLAFSLGLFGTSKGLAWPLAEPWPAWKRVELSWKPWSGTFPLCSWPLRGQTRTRSLPARGSQFLLGGGQTEAVSGAFF